MKKLQKLKLNKLSVEALENREMNQLAGGCYTQCSCCYNRRIILFEAEQYE